MNEQALQQTKDKPSIADAKQQSPIAKTLILLMIASLIIASIGIAFHWFGSVEGTVATAAVADEESVEIQQIEITNEAEAEVPLSAITAQIDQGKIDAAEHPLTPLIEMGKRGQQVIAENVGDYTAILTKRLRVKGKLQPEEKLFIKIRHPVQNDDPKESIPFSVYTRFIDPKKGQEVIWVDGQNDNKLIAHGPSGLLNLMTVNLDPEGSMAMNGNRYPIWTIGMLNLIKLMTDEATGDLHDDDCRVEMTRNFKLGDAKCTRFVIVHENKAEHFGFHKAEIYIDDERNLPIGFRSYTWPDSPEGKPKLQERYYYTDIKLNVGLTDEDFDPSNDEYDYPGK